MIKKQTHQRSAHGTAVSSARLSDTTGSRKSAFPSPVTPVYSRSTGNGIFPQGVVVNPTGKALFRGHVGASALCRCLQKLSLRVPLLTVLMVVLSPVPAQARDLVWHPSDLLSNDWNASFFGVTNWLGSLPMNGDSLFFGDAATPSFTINNDFSDIDLENIVFQSSLDFNHTITGNQIDLKAPSLGDGITNNSDGVMTINNALSLQGTGAITFKTFFGHRQLHLNGNITNNADFIKTGAGFLHLGGDNSGMNGDIFIQEGTITLGSGNALSDATTVDISSGAKLFLAGTTEDFGGLSGAGHLDLSGGADAKVGFNNATTTFSGTIFGNGSFEVSSGTLTLSGDNTYSGGTTISDAGTIQISKASNLGTGDLNFGGGGGQLSTSGNIAFNGATKLSDDVDARFDVDSGELILNGKISGSSSLTKFGEGTLSLGNNNENTGNVTILEGTLSLLTSNALADSVDVTVEFGATFALNGRSDTINSLSNGPGTVGGTVDLGNGSSSNGLTIAGGNAHFAGTIIGDGSLTKIGSGDQVLSGDNTYTGGTNINGGVLTIFGNQALGTGGLSFNGGTLDTG
ncbi:MAG: autotransporter-associated beta strand protein, partial [Gammaproteobacteria bacterium]